MTTPTSLTVLGAGPAGYPAAFLAADLGLSVTLVEMDHRLGGTCLHRGCIPSKALLHAARLLTDAREASAIGLDFAPPVVQLDKLREWKTSVTARRAPPSPAPASSTSPSSANILPVNRTSHHIDIWLYVYITEFGVAPIQSGLMFLGFTTPPGHRRQTRQPLPVIIRPGHGSRFLLQTPHAPHSRVSLIIITETI